MKSKTAWDDDEIRFAGFGSAHAVDYAEPDKKPPKRPKVGFVWLKKGKLRGGQRGS